MRTIWCILLCCLLLQDIYPSERGSGHQLQIDRIIRQALDGQMDYAMLKELCALGSRLSGYPEARRVIDWAAAELETIGCDTVFLQPVEVPYWWRGDTERAEICGPALFKNRRLNIAALGGSSGTGGKPLVAGVIEVNPYRDLARQDSALIVNKYVFFNEPFDHTRLRTFDAYSKAVKQRTSGPRAAEQLGAAGAIVRSVTSLADNVPHVGLTLRDSAGISFPAVAIGVEDAEFLSAALTTHPNLMISLQLSCENRGTAQSFNVIGELRGSTRPDEIILIGGHLDAWDKGHGAHDDAAGCVQAMAVIQLFRQLHIIPKRTIRCVLFADEEQTQSGARQYAAQSDALQEYHLAAIESDRGGFTPRGYTVEADSAAIQALQKFLSCLQPLGIEWIREGGSGADIAKLHNTKAKIGYVPDDSRYFDYHHSANDTFEKVHPRELALGTASIAVLTYLLSEFGL